MLSKEVSFLKDYLETKGAVLELEFSEDTDFVEIKWQKDSQHHYVYSTDIVYHKGRLAWFQASEENRYRLYLLYEQDLWEWEPEMYNPFFGCLCLELQWIQEHLVFVYREKHDIYIATVYQGEVQHHNFNGEKFKLTTSRFTYQTYGQSSRDLVSVLEIPSLQPLETIEWRVAKQLGLAPYAIV